MAEPDDDDDVKRFIEELTHERNSEDSTNQILIPKAIEFIEEEKSIFQKLHNAARNLQENINRMSINDD
jgi:hypothetical protein